MTKWADFMEKNAQSSGFVPSYRYGAAGSADKELHGAGGWAKSVGKGLGAGLGAGAGVAHWLWEKATSEEALSWLAKAFDYENSNPFSPRTPRMSDMSFGRHKNDDILPLADHVRAGENIGAQPVTWKRLGSDAKTTAYGIGNDYFLVSDDKMNEVQKENDKAILDQMRSLHVDIPDSPPRDENGILVATGQPEYQEYDEFINGARLGQGVGRQAIGYAAPVAATKAVANGVKAVRNVAIPLGTAERYGRAAFIADSEAARAAAEASRLRSAASRIKPRSFGRNAARRAGQAARARAGQQAANVNAQLARAEENAAAAKKTRDALAARAGWAASAERKWDKAERIAGIVADKTPLAYPAAAGTATGIRDIERRHDNLAKDGLSGVRRILEEYGPGSEEYSVVYNMAKDSKLDLSGLPAPGAVDVTPRAVPKPNNVSRTGASWGDWYNGMTGTGKAITVGAGGAGLGALLGAIFGGKGGWWKWGLLGALLGALGGNGKLKELWNGLSAGKAGNG